MLGLSLAWNTHFTGHPLRFTHGAAQPRDGVGFGKRIEGHQPDMGAAVEFTPRYAFWRIFHQTLPCVSLNAMGWGYYDPDLFLLRYAGRIPGIEKRFRPEWRKQRGWLYLRMLPLVFPFLLVAVPLLHRSRSRYDLLFLLLPLANLLFYFPFYFEGATQGSTPVNARYYAESTLLGVIPLLARGILIVYDRMRRPGSKVWVLVAALLAVGLALNTVYTYTSIGRAYRDWSRLCRDIPDFLRSGNIHNAVVFVEDSRVTPIGDYPFRDLAEADIVYFRLGPAPEWGLNTPDWRVAYEDYFEGRTAYIYRNRRMVALRPFLQVNPQVNPH
jgi:hypothetical protein